MASAETLNNDSSKSEFYQKLTKYGIHAKVAEELDSLQKSGLLGDDGIDDRAMDAIKEFNVEQALEVLDELKKSNLDHVTNRSAYICGLMKTYRHKQRADGAAGGATGGKQGAAANNKKPGPDEAKLKAILDRTKYSLDVTTGQRKYGGPPPNWDGPQPGSGHEVFCGKVPKDVFEDELVPLFEKCGQIWDLRLMMDPLTGLNRGFCFVTFVNRDAATEAVKTLNGFEIKPGKALKVNHSVANVRLFVGNIPKNRSRDDILEEFKKHTEGLIDVIIYNSPDDQKKKNRGFAFLEYDNHKSASMAKHRLGNGYTKVWGCDIIVDWADPQEQPDEETMSKVKVLYVRNLKSDVTEEQLREKFEKFGKVERVKKIKDYGFVHFEDRENALKALNELNGQKVGESEMEISLAKPPTENKAKEKRKQQYKLQFGRGFDDFYLPPYQAHMMAPPLRGGRGLPRPPNHPRLGFRPPQKFIDYESGYYYPHYAAGPTGGVPAIAAATGGPAAAAHATTGANYKDFRGGYTEDYDYYGLPGSGEVEDYASYYGSSGIGGYVDLGPGAHGGANPRGARGGMSSRGGTGFNSRGGHAGAAGGGFWSGGPPAMSYVPQGWGVRGPGGAQWGGASASQRR